jgi:lipopolysaccharide export system protein LptC
MSVSSKVSLMLFIVLSGLLTLSFYYSKPFSAMQPNASNVPDWYIQHAKMTNINAQGLVSAILTSPHLKHFTDKNVIHIETPFLITYDKSRVPWHIHANKGLAYQGKNKKIDLIGDVSILQLPGKTSNNAKLTTTQMSYFPNQNIAETNEPVTITEPGSIMHSVGFRANLKKGIIHFLSRSETEYHANQNQ